MMQTEDKQISLTDPDARSMATSGRGSGMVGYNVQSAVDTRHHLIVTHEVTNVGSDRSQLSRMSEQARAAIGSETIEAVADRGYYSGEEIVACEQAGVTVYLPKPMTSGLLAKGRFGKQDFVYVAADDVYLCPSGEQLHVVAACRHRISSVSAIVHGYPGSVPRWSGATERVASASRSNCARDDTARTKQSTDHSASLGDSIINSDKVFATHKFPCPHSINRLSKSPSPSQFLSHSANEAIGADDRVMRPGSAPSRLTNFSRLFIHSTI
jgi:hypothetical protein